MKIGSNVLAGRKTRSVGHLLWQCCFDALETRQLLSTSYDVLQWGNGPTGNVTYPNEVTLTPSNVNSSQFGRLGKINMPAGGSDQIYAQPLIVQNVLISGHGSLNNTSHSLVIVATEANNVYAYDTNSLQLIWSLNVGAPILAGTPGGPNQNNIHTEDGITGTPVIDYNSSTMFLDSIQEIGGTTSHFFVHKVLAINIASGSVTNSFIISDSSNTVAGGTAISVLGNVANSSSTGTREYFNPGTQLQRPGLTILNGVVYIAYGAYGNTDPYNGWILGFSEGSLSLTSVFADTPNQLTGSVTSQSTGSIWQSGVELTTDGTYLYVVTGNGLFNANATINDYAMSALKLLPDTNIVQSSSMGTMSNGYGIHIADYFAPWNANFLGDFIPFTSGDLDLGTSGAMLLPDQPGPFPHEEIMVSKEGVVYVVNRDAMGANNATGGNDSQIIQVLSFNGKGQWGDPSYYNGFVYFHQQAGVMMKFALNNGLLSTTPVAVGSITIGSEGATTVVSSNGTNASSAVVWEIDNSGALRAYDPGTLTELYDSNINSSADSTGTVEHFSVPVVDNGQVWVGGSLSLSVYGLKTSPFASAPAAPTSLTVNSTSSVANSITLGWTGTAVTNEQNFLIERSTSAAGPYTQIASVGIDINNYADTTATDGVTYFYRVRAANSPGGNSAYTSTASGSTQALSIVGNLYHFDEGSGTAVGDSIGGTNNGTLSGATTIPTWATSGYLGTAGSALIFNGNNGSMTDNNSSGTLVGASVTFHFTLNGYLAETNAGVNGATTDFWIKTTETGVSDTNPTLDPAVMGITKLNGVAQFPPTAANTQDASQDIRLGYINMEGQIGIAVDGYRAVSNPGDKFGVTSTTPINDGVWHNVALTRNALNGLLQVYVDGVLEGSFYGDTGAKQNPFGIIGGQIQSLSTSSATTVSVIGHTYFIGALDEMRNYNFVISPSEIAQLAAVPPAPSGLNAIPVSATSIQLTWNAVAATGIDIFRRTGTSGSFSSLISIQGNATSFTDTLLTAGTQYFYEIRAGDPIGTSSFTTPVSAIAAAPSILTRATFYNNSFYDSNDVGNNTNDDNAIALDKSALLPSATPTFANYTSYDKGVNGIIVDVSGTLSGFTAADITLKTGNNSNPASWTTITDATIAFRMIPGGGGTRFDITIPSGEVSGAWLQVTIDKTHTQLTTSDQFYFGNAPGSAGVGSPVYAEVNAVDEISARYFAANLATQSNAAAIVNIYDYNRDKQVSPADEAVAGAHYTTVINALLLFTTPAGPAFVSGGAPAGLPADTGTDTTSTGTGPTPSTAPTPPAADDPPSTDGTSPTVVTVAGHKRKNQPVRNSPPIHVPRINGLKRTAFSKVFDLLAARFGRG